jgi:hypothetical protein
MRKIIILLFVLLLAGCQAAPTSQTAPAQPLQVALSDSLSWLEPDLADCAAQAGVAVQRVDGSTAGTNVIQLRLGAPDEAGYAALLGMDELAIIVAPENPLQALSLENAQAIFAGIARTWADQSQIQVWALPQASDVSAAFLNAGFRVTNAGLAPTPATMLEVVAENPAAIGYLPARWLNDQVRALEVDGLKAELPILAISAEEPQDAASALLVCLQEKIAD